MRDQRRCEGIRVDAVILRLKVQDDRVIECSNVHDSQDQLLGRTYGNTTDETAMLPKNSMPPTTNAGNAVTTCATLSDAGPGL